MKAMLTAILAMHHCGRDNAAAPSDIILGQSAPLSGGFGALGQRHIETVNIVTYDAVDHRSAPFVTATILGPGGHPRE